LLHKEELEQLTAKAQIARKAGDVKQESSTWRRALEILPPDTRQYESISQRVGELSRLLEQSSRSSPETGASTEISVADTAPGKRWKWAGLGALVLLIWKLKSVLAFVITKGKFLLAGLTKSGTFFSMILSFGVYWTAFGWKFAVGLIISIYVHEMGHVAALHRFGIRASSPMFIPGVGAFVRLGQYPVDAREDARVGLAGPMWGLGAALVAYLIFLASSAPSWGAIARVGAWINLFNLLPVWQLDGSRGFRALTRAERFLVTATIGVTWFLTGEGLLLLLGIAAALQAWGGKAPEQGDRTTLVQFLALIPTLSAMCLIQVPLG
jgi:Zn-dependent protease